MKELRDLVRTQFGNVLAKPHVGFEVLETD